MHPKTSFNSPNPKEAGFGAQNIFLGFLAFRAFVRTPILLTMKYGAYLNFLYFPHQLILFFPEFFGKRKGHLRVTLRNQEMTPPGRPKMAQFRPFQRSVLRLQTITNPDSTLQVQKFHSLGATPLNPPSTS